MKKNNSRNVPGMQYPAIKTFITKREFLKRPTHYIYRVRRGEKFLIPLEDNQVIVIQPCVPE